MEIPPSHQNIARQGYTHCTDIKHITRQAKKAGHKEATAAASWLLATGATVAAASTMNKTVLRIMLFHKGLNFASAHYICDGLPCSKTAAQQGGAQILIFGHSLDELRLHRWPASTPHRPA